RNEDNMPVDMHMLLALTAPRAIYVASADEDLWADPKGSYLALLNALPVYRLLGHNPVLGDDVPPLNKQVISGRTGYHIRNGAHNMLLSDWQMFMNFADSVYK
ncbi:MAG: acetylxylan esterase, partial [Bacteroidales bacterium]|nr:acetylxylan esterase [Bacteroidales bacterium]